MPPTSSGKHPRRRLANGHDSPTRAEHARLISVGSGQPRRSSRKGAGDRGPPAKTSSGLQGQLSAVLREQLLTELADIGGPDQAADWARKRLEAKNTLSASDAVLVEEAFARRLDDIASVPGPVSGAIGSLIDSAPGRGDGGGAANPQSTTSPAADGAAPPAWLGPPDTVDPTAEPRGVDKSVLPIGAPRRFRDKAHLAFVASQPCLLCGRRPVDPHHIRFAQKQSLGRKVSDELTVPLCRSHHRALHRSGSEYLWWENVGIDPLKAARKMWRKTRSKPRAGASEGSHGPRTSPTTTAAVTSAIPRTQPSAETPGIAVQQPGNNCP